MDEEDKKGFYEWLVVSVASCESDPESSLPPCIYKKPNPPRKRRRRRYEKCTQTDFFKAKKIVPKVVTTSSIQTDSPPPPPYDRSHIIVFISGMMVGIMFKKCIKNI